MKEQVWASCTAAWTWANSRSALSTEWPAVSGQQNHIKAVRYSHYRIGMEATRYAWLPVSPVALPTIVFSVEGAAWHLAEAEGGREGKGLRINQAGRSLEKTLSCPEVE